MPSDFPRAKANRIIDNLREQFPDMAIAIFKRKNGYHTYAYNQAFVAQVLESIQEFSDVAKMKKVVVEEDWYTDSELAKKFKTISRIVRDTIVKYKIGDEETVLKDESHWKIHKSLYSEIREQLVPSGDYFTTGGKIGSRPTLDRYDGNFD
jgi:hypothetical protein